MGARRHKRRGSNAVLLAGLFLAFSLALFTGLYFFYGKLGRSWRGLAELRVLFTQARALKPGAPVLYDGMEVGRIKEVRIVHVGGDLLNNLRPLTKEDRHNLPISSADREAFDRMPEPEVDAAMRKTIDGRIMVLAVFDVLMERDEKRLREDDAYFVATSKLGDSRIEIVTGKGKPIAPKPGAVVLGVNADLISDIGKNLAQIEDIMQSIADIIGGNAGKALIQDQLKNFEGFTANLDTQTESMLAKVPEIWDGIDLRADQSKKNMDEISEKILAIFPKVDAAIDKTSEAISSMHGNLGKSAQSAVDQLKTYRNLAKDEVSRWRKLSEEYRGKTPARMKELRKTTESALAAAGKLDEMLGRLDAELNLSAKNARATVGLQTESAMALQEVAWQFKKSIGYFTSKYTPEQLSQRHLAWRFDMARTQYAELRRELSALQNELSADDPADRERAKIIEEKLSGSDAFFSLSRADFVPGELPLHPVPPVPDAPGEPAKKSSKPPREEP